MLAYWPGAIFASVAVWFVWRAGHARLVAQAAPPPSGRLSGMADIMPPIVATGLVLASAEIVIAFVFGDATRWFAWSDLGAFVAMLLGYWIWFRAKLTTRRPSDTDATSRGPAPAPPPQAP